MTQTDEAGLASQLREKLFLDRMIKTQQQNSQLREKRPMTGKQKTTKQASAQIDQL